MEAARCQNFHSNINQFLYPLKKKDGNRAVKVSSRLSKDDMGMTILMASHKAIGIVLGKLPETQRPESTDNRFAGNDEQPVPP